MIKRETPFLLCETICEAVRLRLPEAISPETTFFFDYEGLMPVSTMDPSTVQTLVDRLLRYALRAFDRAGVFFRVIAKGAEPSRCQVRINVTTILRPEATSATESATHAPGETPSDADLGLAHRLCRSLGGGLTLQRDRSGALVEAEFYVPVLAPAGHFEGSAGGASAWLVSSPTFVMKMLARRLERLEWKVRLFESAAEAEATLDADEGTSPALVVASAHRGVTLDGMRRLRAKLPAGSQLVLQALQQSTVEPGSHTGIDILAIPLSPRRLMHFTELAKLSGQRPSGNTQAGELETPRTELVLVVDDNMVNRALGEEVVRMMGYRVTSVDSGEAAIAHCTATPPGLVLMDLDMPGIGGLEATRRLRDLQTSGALTGFPIVALSAMSADEMADLTPHPFDAAMSKPIDIPLMRTSLFKWMAPLG